VKTALSVEAETGGSWIPGLALLARNDGRVVFVISAKLVPDLIRDWNSGGVVRVGHCVSE
jgi:hypothetical protein